MKTKPTPTERRVNKYWTTPFTDEELLERRRKISTVSRRRIVAIWERNADDFAGAFGYSKEDLLGIATEFLTVMYPDFEPSEFTGEPPPPIPDLD